MAKTLRAGLYLDKGGTGKTTNAAHLGAALSQLGYSVLLLDLAGKQGDLAEALGVAQTVKDDIAAEDDFPNLATTMTDRWADVAEMIGDTEAVQRLVYPTESGPDLMPAHPDLDGLDADLGNIDDASDRYSRLQRFLDSYVDPLDLWDVVLLDMPGVANNITYNGLWGAPNVVAPVSMGGFELKQARSLESDLATIRSTFDRDVHLQMVIPNMHDRRTKLHSRKLDEFSDEFGELLAPKAVVDSQDIRRANEHGYTLFDLNTDELLSTGKEARTAFLNNADELYNRLEAAHE